MWLLYLPWSVGFTFLLPHLSCMISLHNIIERPLFVVSYKNRSVLCWGRLCGNSSSGCGWRPHHKWRAEVIEQQHLDLNTSHWEVQDATIQLGGIAKLIVSSVSRAKESLQWSTNLEVRGPEFESQCCPWAGAGSRQGTSVPQASISSKGLNLMIY